MNYSSEFFQKLQFRLYDVFNDVDPLHGPMLEDDLDYDEYFKGYIEYDQWLKGNNGSDEIKNRKQYLLFILSLIGNINSPDFFAYHLEDHDFEILEDVIEYFINEVTNENINSENEFYDFMVSTHAERFEDLEGLRIMSDEIIVERYFNKRWDLFNFFISGLYSIHSHIYYRSPEM